MLERKKKLEENVSFVTMIRISYKSMSMFNTHNGIFKICVPWNTYMSTCVLELSSLEILSCIDVENWHIENSHICFL